MAAVPLTMSLDKESQDDYNAKIGTLAPVATLGNNTEEFLYYIYVGEFSEFSIVLGDYTAAPGDAFTGKVYACNDDVDLTLANNMIGQLGADLAVGATRVLAVARTYVGNYKYILITGNHGGGATALHVKCSFHGKLKGGN